MRETRIQQPRCVYAITDGEIQSRCMKARGHNGGHVAPDVKEYPYTRIHWFAGDHRESITKKENTWAWRLRPSQQKGKKSSSDESATTATRASARRP